MNLHSSCGVQLHKQEEIEMQAQKAIKPVRVSGYGGGQFSLTDLAPDESDILQGAFRAGTCWVRRNAEGRIEHAPYLESLPTSVCDIDMQPFWNPAVPEETPVQYELFRHIEDGQYQQHADASITIQHLCGYGYTPENYAYNAELLESYGFACLRSRRGNDGQFWEVWYLPGVWSARGRLKEAVFDSGQKDPKQKTAAAMEYIRRTVSFGTLDLSVQRLAQVID